MTIEIDVGDWNHPSESERRIVVILDPGGPRVYTWIHAGAGLPEPAIYDRHRVLTELDTSVDPESLEVALEGLTEDLERLAGLYRGESQPNHGGPRVGQWQPDADLYASELVELIGGRVVRRWPAGEWLDPLIDDLIDRVRARGLEAVVAEEVEEGRRQNVRLDPEDVADTLRAAIEEMEVPQ